VIVLGRPFQLNLIFVSRLHALPRNIRLDWKAQPGKNILAYHEHFINYVQKQFYNIGSKTQCIKMFFDTINLDKKLECFCYKKLSTEIEKFPMSRADYSLLI
jgi:hypothetical protein